MNILLSTLLDASPALLILPFLPFIIAAAVITVLIIFTIKLIKKSKAKNNGTGNTESETSKKDTSMFYDDVDQTPKE